MNDPICPGISQHRWHEGRDILHRPFQENSLIWKRANYEFLWPNIQCALGAAWHLIPGSVKVNCEHWQDDGAGFDDLLGAMLVRGACGLTEVFDMNGSPAVR